LGDEQRLLGGWPLQHVQCRRQNVPISGKRVGPHLFGKTLGKFDQNAPIGRILDFSEGDDEPQPFDNIQVDFIFAKQLQKLVPGVIGIVDVHRSCSGRR
jgi:hypothetical protein